MNKVILFGLIAGICVLMMGMNGNAMQNDMAKTSSINTMIMGIKYCYTDETNQSERLGAVTDFRGENGTHDSMVIITYDNNEVSDYYNLSYNTYNEINGLEVQEHYAVEENQITHFEAHNNSAVLNDTLYYTYSEYGGHPESINEAPSSYGQTENPLAPFEFNIAKIGYYVNSQDFNHNIVSGLINADSLSSSLVVYQGFLVWSIDGAMIYYTGLPDSPVAHKLNEASLEGCQRNCIFNGSLWFASDTHLYQIEGEIGGAITIYDYDIAKDGQEVTALDSYISPDGTPHMVVCYSNDDAIYEFTANYWVKQLREYSYAEQLYIETITSTRNFNGDLFISGKTQSGRIFIARMTETMSGDPFLRMVSSNDLLYVGSYTEDSILCNLTSEEQLYEFNTGASGHVAWKYAGETPIPSRGAGITITLTKAGHWTTGKHIELMFEYVGNIIEIKARIQCSDGISGAEVFSHYLYPNYWNMELLSGTAVDGMWGVNISSQPSERELSFKISAVSYMYDDHSTPQYTLSIIPLPPKKASLISQQLIYVVPVVGIIAVASAVWYFKFR